LICLPRCSRDIGRILRCRHSQVVDYAIDGRNLKHQLQGRVDLLLIGYAAAQPSRSVLEFHADPVIAHSTAMAQLAGDLIGNLLVVGERNRRDNRYYCRDHKTPQ
jgi:hypothetical protein